MQECVHPPLNDQRKRREQNEGGKKTVDLRRKLQVHGTFLHKTSFPISVAFFITRA
jgi:hypothetical protein